MRTVSTSPHLHSGADTQRIMLCVVVALLPSCAWGVFVFGLKALAVLCVAVASAVLSEYLLGLVSKENTLWDCSAVVTGLLVGMNMPYGVPLYIPAIASVFAIAVVKWTFGGLGANWANPAMAGRVFVFFSFTSQMSTFSVPRTLASVEVASQASPLSLVKTIVSSGQSVGLSSLDILSQQGVATSAFAQRVQASTGISAYNVDAFVGNIPGCIGEVSKLLLLVGGLYLLIRNVITWHIPVSFIGSFGVLTWVFGGLPLGLGLFHGEVLEGILRGGLILGAFFMATDMVTSPVTYKGMVIFGCGCGAFTFLFRTFGSLPEATSVAILLMNIVTPTIDRYVKPRLFGEAKKGGAKA